MAWANIHRMAVTLAWYAQVSLLALRAAYSKILYSASRTPSSPDSSHDGNRPDPRQPPRQTATTWPRPFRGIATVSTVIMVVVGGPATGAILRLRRRLPACACPASCCCAATWRLNVSCRWSHAAAFSAAGELAAWARELPGGASAISHTPS